MALGPHTSVFAVGPHSCSFSAQGELLQDEIKMLFRQFSQKGSLLLWLWEWPLGFPFKKELARKLEERSRQPPASAPAGSILGSEPRLVLVGISGQVLGMMGGGGGWTLTVSTHVGPSKSWPMFSAQPHPPFPSSIVSDLLHLSPRLPPPTALPLPLLPLSQALPSANTLHL